MTHTHAIGGLAPAGEIAARERLSETAKEFEAVFISQMLRALTDGLEGEGPLGGGEGEPFRGLLGDEIGKLISRSGGVGIADAILKEMLKMQEVA